MTHISKPCVSYLHKQSFETRNRRTTSCIQKDVLSILAGIELTNVFYKIYMYKSSAWSTNARFASTSFQKSICTSLFMARELKNKRTESNYDSSSFSIDVGKNRSCQKLSFVDTSYDNMYTEIH